MKVYPQRPLHTIGSALFLLTLLILASACQSGTTQSGQHSPARKTPTSARLQNQAFSVISHHGAPHPTPTTLATPTLSATPTPPQTTATQNTIAGTPPGPIPAGSGTLPSIFPHYLSFGVMSAPGTAAELDGMRSSNGTAFTFRYQYLSGGVNTGHGWETWNTPPGQFASYYMQENAQDGYIPTFTYYELCQTNGPQPGTNCAGHDLAQDTGNLTNTSAMNAYYANWTLLMQKIHDFGKPVLVIVEPDLWGFLQHAANGSDNAASVPASVASSGYPALAGYPDTAQGFAWALLHLRDLYATNAVLALHASLWATTTDIGSDTRSDLDVTALAQREANFLNSAGLLGTPAGVSTWDLLSNDVADHDSGQPGGRSWWDRYNQTFPNFSRYLDFMGQLSQDTHRRIVVWQVPIGNQYFTTMNNSNGHYQDNRAEYILSNPSSFAAAGIVAVLFGPGNGGTMNTDATHDGTTNPAPISSYECNNCNTHTSSYPDDDGGFLRIFVGQYLQHPVSIG